MIPLKLKSSGAPFDARARQSHALSVSAPRELVDYAPAGITQLHELGDFVEGFAGRVVAGLPEHRVAAEILDQEECGVAAGHDQRQEWHRHALFEHRGEQMALDVVDADHRQTAGLRQSLGEHQSDQQRSDQAGSARHGDRVQVAEAASGGLQRLPYHRQDRDDVIARGELGHDSAVAGVNQVLIGDRAGADARLARAPGFDNRRRRVVA